MGEEAGRNDRARIDREGWAESDALILAWLGPEALSGCFRGFPVMSLHDEEPYPLQYITLVLSEIGMLHAFGPT